MRRPCSVPRILSDPDGGREGLRCRSDRAPRRLRRPQLSDGDAQSSEGGCRLDALRSPLRGPAAEPVAAGLPPSAGAAGRERLPDVAIGVRVEVPVDLPQHVDGHAQVARDLLLVLVGILDQPAGARVAEAVAYKSVVLAEDGLHGEHQALLWIDGTPLPLDEVAPRDAVAVNPERPPAPDAQEVQEAAHWRRVR